MEEQAAREAKEEPHPVERKEDNRRQAQLAHRLQYVKTVRHNRETPAPDDE